MNVRYVPLRMYVKFLKTLSTISCWEKKPNWFEQIGEKHEYHRSILNVTKLINDNNGAYLSISKSFNEICCSFGCDLLNQIMWLLEWFRQLHEPIWFIDYKNKCERFQPNRPRYFLITMCWRCYEGRIKNWNVDVVGDVGDMTMAAYWWYLLRLPQVVER